MAKTIIIDAGHGGLDNGAMYRGRKEKDDALKLAMSLGELLEKDGYTVQYTRTDDRYQSPFEKAQMGNQMGGDLFLSIHRDFDEDGEKQGARAFVFKQGGVADITAEKMLQKLQEIGFDNLGVEVKNGLAILKRTVMPAIMLEVGYVNSAEDNRLFDTQFSRIVVALADAIEEVFPQNDMETEEIFRSNDMETEEIFRSNDMETEEVFRSREDMETEEVYYPAEDMEIEEWNDSEQTENVFCEPEMQNMQLEYRDRRSYWIQTGIFSYYENAAYQKELLEDDGYPVQIFSCGSDFAVRVGTYFSIDDAADMQKTIRNQGYDTLIISE